MDELSPEVFELIKDLCAGALNRFRKRSVRLSQCRFELIELFIESFFGLCKPIGCVAIQTPFYDFGDRGMQAIEEVLQLESILAHGFLMPSFDQRKTRARKHARLNPSKDFVDRIDLRKVSDLRRTANVGGSRQEEVLNHRTQRHIGTETVRTLP